MSKPNEKTTQTESHALVWDRLMLSQGILGRSRPPIKATTLTYPPCTQ